MTWRAVNISQTIDRDPADVIAYAGNPENLSRWAGGLGSGVRRDGDRWVADTPAGLIEISFTGPLSAGVLDHDVTLPGGEVVHNPLRVLRNDDGCEVVFTLYQRPGMTDTDFEADAAMVRADLERLRSILED